jgi:transposase
MSELRGRACSRRSPVFCSPGPVEGHINQLKLIKCGAYGRMKVDLLH